MSSRYYLTFKSTFQPENPKKLDKTTFNVKFFDWDYLHLTAQTKETYFRLNIMADKKNIWSIFSLVVSNMLSVCCQGSCASFVETRHFSSK